VPTHQFLSPGWISAALEIRDEFAARHDVVLPSIRINLVVSDVPFGDGSAAASIDTSSGSTIPRIGLVDEPDATVTLDYRTAYALLVGRDPQAAMLAFMSGSIRVDGDLAKLLALQQLDAPQSAEAIVVEAHTRVLEITAPLD
jgi:hypothetical protein